MRRTSSFLIGAIIGGTLGAIIAIMLAPSSGESLRSNLSNRTEQMRSDIARAATERRAELERQLAALRAPKAPE
jgi:gas vesicle protein